jgi:hypothetical protein
VNAKNIVASFPLLGKITFLEKAFYEEAICGINERSAH